MGKIKRNCPHCHTKSVLFTSFGEIRNVNQDHTYLISFFCGNCYGGYMAMIKSLRGGQSAHRIEGNIEINDSYYFINEYPLPKEISSPKYLPDNINKFFLQAAESLKSGNLDASAMMSRKVLEVAVKTLNPDGNGNLYRRIEKLSELGKITDELKDWAHIIRDDGNDATHEEEPVTLEFAEELLSFSEMFLMYTFTMPGMVSDRRHQEIEPN